MTPWASARPMCHTLRVDQQMPSVTSGQLLELRREELLPESAFLRALDWSAGPPDRVSWVKFLRRWSLILGIALITSGVLFFFAYNWSELTRFQKFGLLETLIVGGIIGLYMRGMDSTEGKAFLASSAVLVGVLLAVTGQVYQTGADSYRLFLEWSLLILPWCLAGRFTFLWMVEAVLANVTFVLFWD